MAQENEIIMLALGMGVYCFAVAYKGRLARIPHWKTLWLAFRLLFAAWVMTVLEGFFWTGPLNLLEHFCYALSTAVLALWCYKTAWAGSRKRE